jgi:two-component system response regulator FixJ
MSKDTDISALPDPCGSEPIVYIVDDEPAVSDALRMVLETEGFKTLGFETGSAFLEACSGTMQGCVLLDLCLPDYSGLAVQKMLAEREVHLPIIFLTGHGTVPSSSEAFRHGALDFLEKPIDTSALLQRVAEALEVDEQRVAQGLKKPSGIECYRRLSDRQQQVLQYIVSGCSTKEMAQKMGISHRTVDIYRKQMMRKMNATTLVELMRSVTPLIDETGRLP